MTSFFKLQRHRTLGLLITVLVLASIFTGASAFIMRTLGHTFPSNELRNSSTGRSISRISSDGGISSISGSISGISSGSISSSMSRIESRTGGSTLLRMTDLISDLTSIELVDGNGVKFTKDGTVQTTKLMKAYQSRKKGYGSYEGTTFVPLDMEKEGGVTRADKCFVIPMGLRGIVSKVYDLDEFDASQPIVAKFIAGDSMGGEYEPPITNTVKVADFGWVRFETFHGDLY
eukprot:scaffold2727_cov275-Chaetoceros_neogracile.AAC.30